jgi:thioredoxin reductase
MKFVLLLIALIASVDAIVPIYKRYIIVGAGPAGLQMGHYLETAGREYLILDKASTSGSFFAKFPRWGQLISINKKFTGQDILDHSMRHDWNSLLTEPSHSGETRSFFPTHEVPCSNVQSSTKKGGSKVDEVDDSSAKTCLASGYSSTDQGWRLSSVPNGTRFSDFVDEYYPNARTLQSFLHMWSKELPLPTSPYKPSTKLKRKGLNIQYDTEIVQIKRPMGFQSHSNKTLLDALEQSIPQFILVDSKGKTYSCTVLLFAGGFQALNTADGVNIHKHALTYWTHPTNVSYYQNKSVLILGHGNAAFEITSHIQHVASYIHLIGRNTGRIKLATETHYPGSIRRIHSNILETYLLKSMDGVAEIDMRYLEMQNSSHGNKIVVTNSKQPCTKDMWNRPNNHCLFRNEYDVVISCPGWKLKSDVFDSDISPLMFYNKKHPSLKAHYESTNVKGLFFLGTLAHSHDFKKASGGFIHGFRYVIRALHRYLEEQELGAQLRSKVESSKSSTPIAVAWPRQPVSGLRDLTKKLFDRINYSSGPYQMFSHLCDVVVLPSSFSLNVTHRLPKIKVLHPALYHPWSYKNEEGDKARPTRIQSLVYRPPPSSMNESSETAERVTLRESLIDQALYGTYFEEVPSQLIPSQVRTWASSIRSSGSTNAPSSVEYLSLCMEYGDPVKIAKEEGYQLREGEQVLDVFASNRARQNRLLHPVLRYFNSAYNASSNEPLLMMELPEDFHLYWHVHNLHVLPVTKFLEQVGQKRVELEELFTDHSNQITSKALFKSFLGNVHARLFPAHINDEKHEFKLMNQIHNLMRVPHTRFFMWNDEITSTGVTKWIHDLSLDAYNHLVYGGVKQFIILWIDPYPFPPTLEEIEYTHSIRLKLDAESSEFDPELAYSLAINPPKEIQMIYSQFSHEEEEKYKFAMNDLTNWSKKVSANVPNGAILVLNGRSGIGKAISTQFGLKADSVLPHVTLFHESLGTTSFEISDENSDFIAYLVKEDDQALARKLQSDPSFKFPLTSFKNMMPAGEWITAMPKVMMGDEQIG